MSKIKPVKKNYQFLRAYKRGKFYVGRILIIYIYKIKESENRLGVSVSKKVGNAVKRNRVRRLVKENYKQIEQDLEKGYEIIFVARKNENIPNYYEIKKEMKFLMKKIGILKQE